MRPLFLLPLLLLTTTTCAQQPTDLTSLNLRGPVLATFQYTHEPVRQENGSWQAGPLQPTFHLGYHFDEAGNQLEQLYINQDYDTDQRYVSTLHDGRRVAGIVYDERDHERLQMALLYDDAGRVFRQEAFFDDGRRQTIENEFTDNAQYPTTVYISQDGSPKERIELTYTDGQIKTHTTYDRGDSLLSSITFEYNDELDPISKTSTGLRESDNYHVDYSNYVYDRHGNWTQRQETQNGELNAITKRRILYYDHLDQTLTQRLAGIWNVREGGGWIRFNTDGTFATEPEEDSEDRSGSWTLSDGSLLTLTHPDPDEPILRYRLRPDTFQLHLTAPDGGEELTLEMR